MLHDNSNFFQGFITIRKIISIRLAGDNGKNICKELNVSMKEEWLAVPNITKGTGDSCAG